jgi:hypothetical protein
MKVEEAIGLAAVGVGALVVVGILWGRGKAGAPTNGQPPTGTTCTNIQVTGPSGVSWQESNASADRINSLRGQGYTVTCIGTTTPISPTPPTTTPTPISSGLCPF